MLQLIDRARDYLLAGGYSVRRSHPGFLDLERATPTNCDRILLWSDDTGAGDEPAHTQASGQDQDAREAALQESFEREMRQAPGATGLYLVDRRLGLSQQFISAAKGLLGEDGGIRTPIEFFDSAYKVDALEGRRARSALSDLLAKEQRTRRVQQSFFIRNGLKPEERRSEAGDLASYLQQAIQEPGPKLRIIEGSAGCGKTFAFNALVASLHRDFIEAKRARQCGRRPIVFLPGHLRASDVGYVDDVIAAVMETDAAEAVSADQFRWLLHHGHAVWLFDGLDEFYAGNNDFFSFLGEALSARGSEAQFLLCTRDSLLSSNEALRSFVDERLAAGSDVEIYELAPWNGNSWIELARLELESRGLGSARAELPAQFRASLERSPELADLAQLPFYCRILFELFLERETLDVDQFAVIQFLVDRMVDREQEKNIFRWQDFVDVESLAAVVEQEVAKHGLEVPPGFDARGLLEQLLAEEGRDILIELIGSIAYRKCRLANGADARDGVSAGEIEQQTMLSNMPFTIGSEVAGRLRRVLTHFALFSPGTNAGFIDFTHPILAEYLAARQAFKVLQREILSFKDINGSEDGDPLEAGVVERAMSRAVGTTSFRPDSLFGRAFAREIRRDPELRTYLSDSGVQFIGERLNADSWLSSSELSPNAG